MTRLSSVIQPQENNGLLKEVNRQNAILHALYIVLIVCTLCVCLFQWVYMLISNLSLHRVQVMNGSFTGFIGQDECV